MLTLEKVLLYEEWNQEPQLALEIHHKDVHRLVVLAFVPEVGLNNRNFHLMLVLSMKPSGKALVCYLMTKRILLHLNHVKK